VDSKIFRFSFMIIIKKYFYPMASVLSDPRQKTGYMAPVLKQLRHKTGYMASGDNRGQNGYLLASPQYASVPDLRQNVENNRDRKPLLHWWCFLLFAMITLLM